jgi:dehydrogenase/reductase SDR family member 12
MICRNEKYGQEAMETIVKETKNDKIHLHVCDISLQRDVRKFVKSFTSQFDKLDCVVNNAGVLLNTKETTSEGIDKTLATNTIGGFLLTELLVPLMIKTGDHPRVVSVSSGGMYTQKLDDDYTFKKYEKKWDGALAYGMTKRHQVVLTEYWATKYDKIQFSAMHPGWADTKGVQTSLPSFREALKNSLRSSAEGADTIVWLAISNNKKLMEENGKFYFDRQATSPHLTWGYTEETKEEQKKLYDDLIQMTSFSEKEENEPIKEEEKIVE